MESTELNKNNKKPWDVLLAEEYLKEVFSDESDKNKTVIRKVEVMGGESKKYDQDKPPLHLLPFDSLNEVAEVLGFGAKKYGAYNWCETGFDWSRLSSAALRHITAWQQGEDNDEESGLNHLAHATCCLLFLLAHKNRGLGKDDRYVPSRG